MGVSQDVKKIKVILADLRELYQDKYVSNYDLVKFENQHPDLVVLQRYNKKQKLKLLLSFRFKTLFILTTTIKEIRHFLNDRNKINKDFIDKETQKEYEIEGNKLDAQQIEAVVACEDAELFLAPAGSGKSASLLAKIYYIMDKLKIPANKILVITFTKKVVSELKDRVGDRKVEIHTFHSLGKKILKSYGDDRMVLSEAEQSNFFKETIKQLRNEDEEYAKKYNDYLLFYQSIPVDLDELKNEQEKIEFNKAFLRRTLKSVSLDKKKYDKSIPTLQNEYVKSKEEQIIANWLFVNGIEYEYERQYDYLDRKYTPDFTIFQFATPIYYEHFAVDETGKSHYPNYESQIEWKRNLHKQNHTTLIETYSYEWNNGTLLANLEKRLKRTGLRVDRMREKEIEKIITSDVKYRADSDAMEELFVTILQLQKNEKIDLAELEHRVSQMNNQYLRQRSLKFLELYKPLNQRYSTYLKENGLYDFADMINDATKSIGHGSEFDSYEYILVDEAQDLSKSRCDLLKALVEKNTKAKMFAVGDDWQSIFRFAGSNLKILNNFSEIFGRETYNGLIESTYRFGEPTIGISKKFIQKNPHQSQKDIITEIKRRTPIEIKISSDVFEKDIPSDYEAIYRKMTELYEKYGDNLANKNIQIISRYNRDIYRIVDETKKYKMAKLIEVEKKNNKEYIVEWTIPGASVKITTPFCTMHRAKGITRDIVFIINMNAGIFGMPSTHTEDPIVSIMLEEAEPFPFAEERRLFYVAITRAKEQTIIVSESGNISPFVYEINPNLEGTGEHICPKCKAGVLVKRINKRTGKEFWGCSNYVNGCNYLETPKA